MWGRLVSDIRCQWCDEPMHRFGWPADADGHEPHQTACMNTLRGALDDALRLIERKRDQGDPEAREFLRRRAESGQGRRYPEEFEPGGRGYQPDNPTGTSASYVCHPLRIHIP